MKFLLIVLVMAGLFWACSGASESGQLDGHSVYKKYCVACHGVRGDMGGNGAFDLSRSALSLEGRVEVIANGRNSMTAFGWRLSPGEIQAVAEYTMQLRPNE